MRLPCYGMQVLAYTLIIYGGSVVPKTCNQLHLNEFRHSHSGYLEFYTNRARPPSTAYCHAG